MIVDDLFESPQACPECGGPAFSDLILAEKKDACYHKVKASAKVWPSAYASGRLVQCRKKGAANWGNKSKNEDVAEGNMPSSVIKLKQKFAEMSPEEFAQRTKDRSDSDLLAMAQRHGYGKGSTYYVDKRKKGQQGMAEELAMKHQRSHSTQKYADTSSSLADRSFGQAERDNVPRTADGHPTVKYRFGGKAGHTRVDPTITATSVKRKDSDQPIPAFLKKDVDEGWKDVVAGGALALGALGAQAQPADLSGYNTQYLQQVAAGEHA